MESEELTWGISVICYLFLAGVGAGALTTSASMLLRGGTVERYFKVARYGAFLSAPLVIVGISLLVFELGRPFRALNLYKVINLSPMSIGSWLLLFFILISIPYACMFFSKSAEPGNWQDRVRRGLAWICIPLGISVAVYTGVLLGAMPSRPLWNSPIVALLFLLSALSTGVAILVLINSVVNGNDPDPETQKQTSDANYLLNTTDAIFIGLEMLTIFLFIMYAHLSVGSQKEAIHIIQFGGELSFLFWFWVVFTGLLIPGVIELLEIVPRIMQQDRRESVYLHSAMNVVVPSLVLIGGFMLRYVVVVAGQLTGPAGL